MASDKLPPVPGLLAGIPSGFFPGLPSNVIRYGELPMWSTYRFVPSGDYRGSVRLFTTAVRQYGQGFGHGRELRHADTNIKQAGCVPGGQEAEIRAVSWDVWGCRADQEHLFNSGVWAFEFMQTAMDIAPASLSQGDPEDRGDGFLRGGVTFGSPLTLPRGSTFSILLRFDESHRFRDECFIRCFLHANFRDSIKAG